MVITTTTTTTVNENYYESQSRVPFTTAAAENPRINRIPQTRMHNTHGPLNILLLAGAKASRWSRLYCFVDVAECGTMGTTQIRKGNWPGRPVEIILELQNWNNNNVYARAAKKTTR